MKKFLVLLFVFLFYSNSLFAWSDGACDGTIECSDGEQCVERIIMGDFQNECQDAPNKDWTIIVYLNADNNLTGAVVGDLNEMMAAGGSDSSKNIIVLVDQNAVDGMCQPFCRLLLKKYSSPFFRIQNHFIHRFPLYSFS